jgi:hypothetical protein
MYCGDDSLGGEPLPEVNDAVVVPDHFDVMAVVPVAQGEQFSEAPGPKGVKSQVAQR